MLDASSDIRRRHIGRYLRQRGEAVGCQAAFTLADGDSRLIRRHGSQLLEFRIRRRPRILAFERRRDREQICLAVAVSDDL